MHIASEQKIGRETNEAQETICQRERYFQSITEVNGSILPALRPKKEWISLIAGGINICPKISCMLLFTRFYLENLLVSSDPLI